MTLSMPRGCCARRAMRTLSDKCAPQISTTKWRPFLPSRARYCPSLRTTRAFPFDRPRELRDLYQARSGLCFDRSRAIEKILSSLGFEVRHAAVYSTKDASRLRAFLTPRTPSHALTEVKTARGWLVIDSNRRWIGLTRDGTPVDLDALRETKAQQAWDSRLKEPMSTILSGPFSYLFGLYSRHGRFYAPYTPIPDADWRQVLYNVTG